MKKIFISLITITLLVVLTLTVSAGTNPRLIDEADVLPPSKESKVLEELDKVSEKHNVDIVIITIDNLYGFSSVEDAALSVYSELGYSENSILLLIGMREREFHVLLKGSCREHISDGERDEIIDNLSDKMKNGYYQDAFLEFIEESNDLITEEISFPLSKKILMSLVIGVVIAFITTAVLKGQLNSVRRQPLANNYLKQGSLNITLSRDLFLYRNIIRRRRQTNNSSGRSSGGSSRGSGKF